jgi:hypothetical protein
MMKFSFMGPLALMLIPVLSAGAQQADSAPKSDSLRQRIEERFAARAQEELGLNNDQAAKLKASSKEFGARRRELAMRERALRDGLEAQLRPGVAANQDSVAKLTDALVGLRLTQAQASRDELKEVSKYLNPVQRARLFMMRERFARHVRDVYDQRHGHDGMGWDREGGRRRARG